MGKALLRTDREIEQIYIRHVKTVYRVCYTYLRNAADTEDAVSSTFVKMIKKAPEFNSEEHEKGWLIRTASNVCKDFLKHWSRHNVDIANYADTLKSETILEADSLVESVYSLPDKYKTVVHLYYYDGYTSTQIANILRKPQSTIRNYLHEARNILKEKLGGILDEER
ncbi:MAG: RNA polymerase sigma factor [Dehalococcoidia bacterium]|nr:RNA polymerase sigma factor [Dehalococcoidia bacterium]